MEKGNYDSKENGNNTSYGSNDVNKQMKKCL